MNCTIPSTVRPFYSLRKLDGRTRVSFDSEIPDVIGFALDDVNLLEFQCHFHSIDIVYPFHGNLWKEIYYGNNPKGTIKSLQNTFVVNNQNTGCTDNFE